MKKLVSVIAVALMIACGQPAENDLVVENDLVQPVSEVAQPMSSESTVTPAPEPGDPVGPVIVPVPIQVPCPCAKGESLVIHNPGSPGEQRLCFKTNSVQYNAHLNHGDNVCCTFGMSIPPCLPTTH